MKATVLKLPLLLVLAAGCATEPTGPSDPLIPLFDLVPVSGSLGFETPTYLTGTINGQDGWSSTGAYDQAVAALAGFWAVPGFGSQSFRISNAVTSGSFGDQTFSRPVLNEAGETAAYVAVPSGTREARFVAQWDVASAVPGAEQPALSVVASPDKGDGGRMSWVQMLDTPSGLEVNFFDYQDAVPYGSLLTPANGIGPEDDFVLTNVASGLSRAVPHTIRIEMLLIDGPHNDVVKVFVDGVLEHTGTSWEDYYRWNQGPGDAEQTAPVRESRVVRSILFRTGGAAVPATAGNGFLIDNMSLASTGLAAGVVLIGPPESKNECKNGGWRIFNNPAFRNQGQCVRYVETHENDRKHRRDHKGDHDRNHRGEREKDHRGNHRGHNDH